MGKRWTDLLHGEINLVLTAHLTGQQQPLGPLDGREAGEIYAEALIQPFATAPEIPIQNVPAAQKLAKCRLVAARGKIR